MGKRILVTGGVGFIFHLQRLKGWLARYKWVLLAATVVLGLMAIIEPEAVYRSTGQDWRGGSNTISGSLYAVVFVLCFLAFHQVPMPFSGLLHQLGRRSYGIYLLHPKVLEFVARVIRQVLPWMLAHQTLYQPVLVALAVGGPLLLMDAVAKSPARRFYRYLFG